MTPGRTTDSLYVWWSRRIECKLTSWVCGPLPGAGGQGFMPPGHTRGNQGLRRYLIQKGSPDGTLCDSRKLEVLRLVFVTGRGGVGFHSSGPALTRSRGGYFSGNPHPAPVRGPPTLIPWTGPRLLPPIFNGDPSGV